MAEMQKVTVEASAELKAELTAQREQNEKLVAEMKEMRKSLQADREKAARAEVDAFIAKISAGAEIRFGKEALEKFKLAYTDAKIATLSDVKEEAALAAKMVGHLDAIAKAQGAIVPAGEKKAAAVTPTDDEPTKEDFAKLGTDRDVDVKVGAAILRYIAANNLTGATAYENALNALAKKVGVSLAMSAPGFSGAGAGAVDDDDEG